MDIIIIGGDAAGMSAAGRLKRKNKDLNVIVLEATADVSYSACSMPYNIPEKDDDINALIVRKPEKFIELGIDLRLGYRVFKIDRKNKKVEGKNSKSEQFSIHYDKLIIATGTRTFFPDIEGLDSAGVFPLKSLEDGRRIKEFISRNVIKSALIIGMGYIGLEMSESLRKLGIKVMMVEASDMPLPWLHEKLRTLVLQELEKNKVEFHTSTFVKRIEKTDKGLLIGAGDKKFSADMVISAMGVVPNSELAINAGLETGPAKSIKINEFMETKDKDILAAGDCALAIHRVSKKETWIPLALTANRGGRFASDNILGNKKAFPGVLGTAVFKLFDYEIARTGLSMKEAYDAGFDPVKVFIKTESKAHTFKSSEKLYLNMIGDKKSGKLLGLFMVGKEGVARRINSGAMALHAELSVEELSLADLAYAPPFSPVWDPVLLGAKALLKKMG